MTTPPATTSSPLLLAPFDLRGLPLRNRVVMAPLTRARVPNDLMLEYYTQRALAGLIISEATAISEQANGWVDSPDTVESFSERHDQPFAALINR